MLDELGLYEKVLVLPLFPNYFSFSIPVVVNNWKVQSYIVVGYQLLCHLRSFFTIIFKNTSSDSFNQDRELVQSEDLEAQMVKNPPAMRETWVWSLGQEDPLEKGMATHSSILAWRIPWREAWRATVHGVAKGQIQLSRDNKRSTAWIEAAFSLCCPVVRLTLLSGRVAGQGASCGFGGTTALPCTPVMQPVPPGQESAGTRWVSYVQMCSVFVWERKKKSVPEEEWLRQTQPQIIYNGSLIGTVYMLSKILWQMSWKEQRKNFYETLVNSQRDFFSDSKHKYFTYSCSFVKQKVLWSESLSVVSDSLWTHGHTVHGILQGPKYWSG